MAGCLVSQWKKGFSHIYNNVQYKINTQVVIMASSVTPHRMYVFPRSNN